MEEERPPAATPSAETEPPSGPSSDAAPAQATSPAGAVNPVRTHFSTSLRRSRLRKALIRGEHRIPLAILFSGLVLTGIVAEQTRRHGQELHEQIERTLLGDVSEAIAVKLNKVVDLTSGMAGLFNAENKVTREQYREYYETIKRDGDNLAGIQGLGFSRFVTAADWQTLTGEVRAEGFPSFSIRPAGPRAQGSAIVYLEPFDLRNQRAFGFDMYSEPTRRMAMDRAAQSGLPSMSGKVRLVQERNTGVQPGVLIYVPIFHKGIEVIPRTPAEYNKALLGWAYSPIRIGDLIRAALDSVTNPDLEDSAVLLHDGGVPNSGSVLYDNKHLLANDNLTDPQYQPIEVAGRTLLVGIQLTRRQIGPNGYSHQVTLVLLIGALGSIIAAQVASTLVTNHYSTREALKQAERANRERALAATVFEASPQAIVVTDAQGRVLSANQSFSRITGYSNPEILGRSLSLLKSGRHDREFYVDLWQSVEERGHWQGEIWNRLHDGEIRPHELSITAVRDADLKVTHYVGMLQDISERHRAQQVIRHQATHDTLTDLPLRAMLMERLNEALEKAERDCGHVGLLFIDLNGFKAVNDVHGHGVGDQLLKQVSQRLRSGFRGNDLVARLGGDEFVVLLPETSNLEEALICASKVQALILSCSQDFTLPIQVSGSIGVAISPEHGITAGQLLSSADAAMYRAKQAGGHQIVVANLGEVIALNTRSTDLSQGG